jgi:hypothetical protein
MQWVTGAPNEHLRTGGGCPRAASCLGPVSPLQPWPRASPPRA